MLKNILKKKIRRVWKGSKEMLEIKGVTKEYTKGKKAVDNLNLTIQNGEIFGFLGPNGARKNYNDKDDNRNNKTRYRRHFSRE